MEIDRKESCMENRKRLNEASIALIVLVAADLFCWFGTILSNYIDGTFEKHLAEDQVAYLPVALVILLVFGAILSGAQIVIGIKGYRNSKDPTGKKGYITAAKIFWVISVLGVFAYAYAVFTTSGSESLDNGLSAAGAALDVCIYTLFIHAANAVHKEA